MTQTKTTDIVRTTIGRMNTTWPASVPGKDRFTEIALGLAFKDPKIRECSDRSKLLALNECCRMGLIPDRNLGHVYLVPFKREVVLIPGYKGMIELARRSGMITTVHTGIVHRNDQFLYEMGTQPVLKHKHWWQVGQSEPGDRVAVYCVAHIRGTSLPQIEVMTIPEVMAIKKRSRASNNGPWVTDEDMMIRKTVVRRAAKLWPLSAELGQMLALDEAVDQGDDIESTHTPTEVIDAEVVKPDNAETSPPEGDDDVGWGFDLKPGEIAE